MCTALVEDLSLFSILWVSKLTTGFALGYYLSSLIICIHMHVSTEKQTHILIIQNYENKCLKRNLKHTAAEYLNISLLNTSASCSNWKCILTQGICNQKGLVLLLMQHQIFHKRRKQLHWLWYSSSKHLYARPTKAGYHVYHFVNFSWTEW